MRYKTTIPEDEKDFITIKNLVKKISEIKFQENIPENVKNGLEIIPVRWIDKVLELALESKPVPLPEEEVTPATAVVAATAPVSNLQGSVKH